MKNILIYPAGSTEALSFAETFFRNKGFAIIDHPAPEATHILLDVPSFAADGSLRGGGRIENLLERLPEDIVVIGGNLTHPALKNYKKLDLLQDPEYLAINADITAHCALQLTAPLLKTTFSGIDILIIGWGRIGKCLARLLRNIGSRVTVAARKEADRAILTALGYEAVDPRRLDLLLPRFRLIFNTAPEPVLSRQQAALCQNCQKIDLASKSGVDADDVIWAKGLPGIYAPESSGVLIAQTIIRLFREGTS